MPLRLVKEKEASTLPIRDALTFARMGDKVSLHSSKYQQNQPENDWVASAEPAAIMNSVIFDYNIGILNHRGYQTLT